MASGTLYPPIVASTMPSFIHDESCKITFKFSDYNTIDDISGLLMTLSYQKTNRTALNSDSYPAAQVFIEKSKIKPLDETDMYNQTYYFYIDDTTYRLNSDETAIYGIKPDSIHLDMKNEKPNGDSTIYRFYMNEYYKVQLRFVAFGYSPSLSTPTYEWINENLDYFSEWSEVTLLKALWAPYMKLSLNENAFSMSPIKMRTLKTLDDVMSTGGNDVVSTVMIDTYPRLSFTGYFSNYTKKIKSNTLGEDIDYYQFIMKSQTSDFIWESDKYTTTYDEGNKIDMSIIRYFKSDQYELYIRIATIGGYVSPYYYLYNIDFRAFEITHYTLGNNNYDNGYISFALPREGARYIWGDAGGPVTKEGYQEFWDTEDTTWDKREENHSWGYYYNTLNNNINTCGYIFRKAEEDDEYQFLGSYLNTDLPSNPKEILEYKDFTVQAGEFYEYFITNGEQKILVVAKDRYDDSYINPPRIFDPPEDSFFPINDNNSPIYFNMLSDYEDMFLYGGDGVQLKIQYNPRVPSVKYKVTDSAYDTLGSQYPILVRNGNLYYKTYSISGLISMQSDPDGFFYLDEDDNDITLSENYELYEKENRYRASTSSLRRMAFRTKNYEFYEEKRFRDKAIAFLMDGKPKLLKSPAEGNAIVKLTDVNFTPNQTLGRMIWDFSATVTELAEFNLDNLNKYHLVEKHFNQIPLIYYNKVGKWWDQKTYVYNSNLTYKDIQNRTGWWCTDRTTSNLYITIIDGEYVQLCPDIPGRKDEWLDIGLYYMITLDGDIVNRTNYTGFYPSTETYTVNGHTVYVRAMPKKSAAISANSQYGSWQEAATDFINNYQW